MTKYRALAILRALLKYSPVAQDKLENYLVGHDHCACCGHKLNGPHPIGDAYCYRICPRCESRFVTYMSQLPGKIRKIQVDLKVIK